MATYTYEGGDFDDPTSWSPQGIPGAVTQFSTPASLSRPTAKRLRTPRVLGGPIQITGGLTITDEGYDLEVEDGDYSVGSIEGSFYTLGDATVTANSVDLSLPNVALSLDDTSSLTVSGSVVANGDDIDTAGQFDVEGGVSITDGLSGD